MRKMCVTHEENSWKMSCSMRFGLVAVIRKKRVAVSYFTLRKAKLVKFYIKSIGKQQILFYLSQNNTGAKSKGINWKHSRNDRPGSHPSIFEITENTTATIIFNRAKQFFLKKKAIFYQWNGAPGLSLCL